jgi:hypothetical protein
LHGQDEPTHGYAAQLTSNHEQSQLIELYGGKTRFKVQQAAA